jgi:hypothetical protein
MTEADVVLTDYVLTAESALFAWLIRQPSTGRGFVWWVTDTFGLRLRTTFQ